MNPSNVSWITATILDFPDRDAAFRIMICPGVRLCATLPPLLPHVETTARRCHILRQLNLDPCPLRRDSLVCLAGCVNLLVCHRLPAHHLLRGPRLAPSCGIELD